MLAGITYIRRKKYVNIFNVMTCFQITNTMTSAREFALYKPGTLAAGW